MSAPAAPATRSTSATPLPTPPARRRALDWRIRFAALSLIWGFSFLLIKVAPTATPPSR